VFSKFVTRRPVVARVLLIGIVLAVGVAALALAVRQLLNAPLPRVEVSASYPGATAQEVADEVAEPIEREVNGVESMVSMYRECTNDGTYRLTIAFRRGTNLYEARTMVQNRVALVQRRLPPEVKETGVAVTIERKR
jgi:multidrug efflux pump subunit AcrB